MKKLLIALRLPVDVLLAVVMFPSAIIMIAYRRFGSVRLPLSTRLLRAIGVFPIRNHYYEPLFDQGKLRHPMNEVRSLPGLELNKSGQLAFLKKLIYADELVELELSRNTGHPNDFRFGNGSFESGDAEFLYQALRHTKPKKVIEIGSGFSTKIARIALARNKSETAETPTHICVEPFEMPWLESLPDVQIIRERVEQSSIDWARELNSGDMLFIDSSHMIRPQGDVLKEYLEIIPVLHSGVYVHVHDIFTPRDYLQEWIERDVKFWNEQYLLEALLSASDRYEIIAAVNYLKHDHYAELKNVCPYIEPTREPGSFYFRIK